MKLLKFSASWCNPCKMLSRIIEDAADKITIPIEEIDIDKEMELAQRYSIRGVPTLILLNDDGHEVKRVSGMMVESKLLEFLGDDE